MTLDRQIVDQPKALPPFVSGTRSTGWWAVAVLILNEAVLFFALIAAYFYTRANSPLWPQDGLNRPELVIPLIMTAILFSSSIAIQWAQNGIRRGEQSRLKAGLLISFLLALIFIGLLANEYSRSEFSPGTNTYSSLFFAITGLHGLHVLAAALINLFVQIRAWRGHFTAERYGAVEVTALFWHFVGAVWLAILFTVYLSPYLG